MADLQCFSIITIVSLISFSLEKRNVKEEAVLLSDFSSDKKLQSAVERKLAGEGM